VSLTIRDAGPGDLDAMAALLAELFAQEAEFEPDAGAQRRGLSLLLENADRGVVLVAERDGAVAGMTVLLYTVSTALGGTVALLEDMVVRTDARGGGTGGRLLDAAIERARADGCLRITLLTDAGNGSAQRFYRRAGFAPSPMIPLRLSLAR
jgi:GNAT superfamily N-acetyltransferase